MDNKRNHIKLHYVSIHEGVTTFEKKEVLVPQGYMTQIWDALILAAGIEQWASDYSMASLAPVIISKGKDIEEDQQLEEGDIVLCMDYINEDKMSRKNRKTACIENCNTL